MFRRASNQPWLRSRRTDSGMRLRYGPRPNTKHIDHPSFVGVIGLEDYDFNNMLSALDRIKAEVDQMIRNSQPSVLRRLHLKRLKGGIK